MLQKNICTDFIVLIEQLMPPPPHSFPSMTIIFGVTQSHDTDCLFPLQNIICSIGSKPNCVTYIAFEFYLVKETIR
jgi:hypothetical protein